MNLSEESFMVNASKIKPPRKGAAAVELAVALPFLLTLLIGILEVSKMIQVQIVLHQACREAGRLAAQGQIINSIGEHTLIRVNSGNPSVSDFARNVLQRAGINTANCTVSFWFTTGNTANTEPYQATKGQEFSISVSIPYSNVSLLLFQWFSPTTLSASTSMVSLVDDTFTIDSNIPGY
jgi:Flp pilus assembly protein TadG